MSTLLRLLLGAGNERKAAPQGQGRAF
jgi:hypothetical protein